MSNNTNPTDITSLLKDSEQLRDFGVKGWLRKLSKKQEKIYPKYLMND